MGMSSQVETSYFDEKLQRVRASQVAQQYPPANAGVVGSIPESGRSPEEGNGNPLQEFLPGKSHGQRNLAGYSP